MCGVDHGASFSLLAFFVNVLRHCINSRVNPSGGQPNSERLVQAVAVATVRRLKRCARNHAGIEIHRVPGLVRQVSSLDNEILLKPPVTVKRCRSCLV